MLAFNNDYSHGAHPAVLQALVDTNMEPQPGYGTDVHTERAKQLIREACQAPDADVFFLVGGTQANATVIDMLLAPYEGVVAAETGHVACHEAGHAAQRQSGYAMMKVRTALVPVVNFTQNTWTIVLLLRLFMNIAGLTTLALIFFSFSVLFQLVTLPVEIDASRRAVAYIEQSGMSSKQVNGARKVLTAAALTYVAAALTSIIQLLYLMARYNRNSNR